MRKNHCDDTLQTSICQWHHLHHNAITCNTASRSCTTSTRQTAISGGRSFGREESSRSPRSRTAAGSNAELSTFGPCGASYGEDMSRSECDTGAPVGHCADPLGGSPRSALGVRGCVCLLLFINRYMRPEGQWQRRLFYFDHILPPTT